MSGPAIVQAGGVTGVISAQTTVIDNTGTLHLAKSNTEGVQRFKTEFESGAVYENEFTASDDLIHRFETASLLLHDVVLLIDPTVNIAALIGDTTNQRFPLNSSWGTTKIDISTLYFKNKTAGQNTKIHIIGTRV